ncbi:MAG: aminomethyl-transferring glycine dehydrogenase subunit GcvPA [Elusimicrobia bacterium]|nr:aminomethyl-transferring glycine dehydrogenase subunit GcvPA [Elusimicrobiota bacterium]
MQFISNTSQEKKEILETIGVNRLEDLFANIPRDSLFSPKINGVLKKGISEMEVSRELQSLADKNRTVAQIPSFLGAGAYHHFVPAAVPALISRGEFLTAYTPYQPEASQGTLQATFEFQTMISELYGMDVANASLYDGASALTEAALLAVRETGRKKILVSRTVHPEYRQTLKTYGKSLNIREIPFLNGTTSLDSLEKELDDQTACVILQTPNFFGSLEEGEKIGAMTHAAGSLLIVSSNPISLGILKSPGNYGADIATGEGQPLGISLNYGGPYLGLFSCKERYLRKIPGRIAGMTKDREGQRGFVLTLQTREQHIRREKATSNICTNEALMALAATIYLSLLGPKGLEEVALLNLKNAHILADKISQAPGFELAFTSPFFNECVVRSSQDPYQIRDHLSQKGIIGGLPLGKFYPDLSDCTLYCATEMNTEKEIESLVAALKQFHG